MYYVWTDSDGVENVFIPREDGGVTTFPNIEANTGPEREAYLAWLAEGNTPEPWPPAES